MKRTHYLLIFSILLLGCKPSIKYDLVINHSTILDIESGELLDNKSVLIKDGKIEEIADFSEDFKSKKTINAKGKLVSPSFIDTHIHPTDIFGDYDQAPEYLVKDSLKFYREKLSNEYLPYGVTTVLMMGHPENWLDPILQWQKDQLAKHTDIYTCGGALISKEDRPTYIGHTTLENPIKAREKLLKYKDLGIDHLKLYYRLKKPEFETVYKVADSLGMKTFGHIGDFNPNSLNIETTAKIGLNNFEHIAIFPNSIMTTSQDWDNFNLEFNKHFGELDSESRVLEMLLEQFRYIKENKAEKANLLIEKLGSQNATFSTTIQRIYEQFKPTYYTKPKDKSLTEAQKRRCIENFRIFIEFTKQMQAKGIKLRIGTDMTNGGKALISELMILCEYGFSTKDVFKIATYNGAAALGIEQEVGSIKKGKIANLIIWSESPFEDYNNFNSKKVIIKSGSVL